jgi:alcohol dehydrogenase (cytochrome c)
VLAIDAKKGDLLWRFKRPIPEDIQLLHPTSRGVGLLGDKVYFAAADAVLVALDAKTGKELWNAKVEDYTHGYYMSLAPACRRRQGHGRRLGRRVRGSRFCRGVRCRDRQACVEDLRVPAPGEQRSETWPKGDQWKTGGGSVRITGAYDPETNLTFWGTGNGGPWMGDQRPGDNLFTSSTIALDASTGKIKGYHQYHPNDSWDWDEVNPPVLVDYQHNGKTVKGLVYPARDGRRCAFHGRHKRPLLPCLRRRKRQDFVGIPHRLRSDGRSVFLPDRRQAIHSGAIGLGRGRGSHASAS